jgi:hypothetical protein
MSKSSRPSNAHMTELMSEAWSAWNASYHETNVEAYRTLSLSLYQQDLHDRIERQFASLDAQNAHLDELLADKAQTSPMGA